MGDLLILLQNMALNGYGVAWHPTHNRFYPFEVERGNSIDWWHDPSGCDSEDFETAVRATHEEMLRQLAVYELGPQEM